MINDGNLYHRCADCGAFVNSSEEMAHECFSPRPRAGLARDEDVELIGKRTCKCKGELDFTLVGAFEPAEQDTMTVEEILNVVDAAYPDGLVKLCAKEKNLKAMLKHGDSLAAFIVTEIRETYDAKEAARIQLAQARHAIENAKMELDKVICALEDKEGSI